jgi:competence protein ComGC
MKHSSNQAGAGFTRLELVVVLVIVVLLGAMAVPAVRHAREKADIITCNGNNKELGIAYRLWAQDHHGLLPFQASIMDGGWSELLRNSRAGQYCWTNSAIMRDEFGGWPGQTVCPADERKPAKNFIVKGSTNDTGNAAFKDNTTVSYFVGVTSSDSYPQSILGGDRNLGPGLVPDHNYGWSPANGQGNDLLLFTNSPVCWSSKMHAKGNLIGRGNILLGDGSVQQASSRDLNAIWLPNAQTGTNFSGTNQAGIRVVFP